MKEQKRKNNDALFDALGYIDDAIIANAETPTRALATLRAKRRALQSCAIAACITLVVSGGGIIYKLSIPNSDAPNDTPSFTDKEEEKTLFGMLGSAIRLGKATSVSSEQINFFDGEMKIVWREKNDGSLYMLQVNQQSRTNLEKSLRLSAKQLTPSDSEKVEYDIWVCMGDGRVVSPQLKYSEGNIGYASLFSYSPEQEPSEMFSKTVSDLINPN